MNELTSLFNLINIPFAYVIRFFDSVTGNYLLTLLLFAVVMKVILFPFGIKQQKNMVKQASLRPKEQAIRKKYAGRTDKITQQKVNEEVMALYQKEGFNPAGGCLPMVFQLIIIWAVYQIVYSPLTYILRLTSDNIAAIRTYLGVADNTREIMMISRLKEVGITDVSKIADAGSGKLPNFCLWGNFGDLSVSPSFGNISWYWIIPILVLVTTFLSTRIIRKMSYQPPVQEGQPDAMKSMKIMDYTMPLFSAFIAFSMPAAIGVYWILQSALGILQQFALSKMYPIPTYTEEELKAFEKEYGAVSNRQKKKQEKARVRSLHHIDDDEYDEKGRFIGPAQSDEQTEEVTPENSAKSAEESTDEVLQRVKGISKAPLKEDKDNKEVK